MSYERLSNGSSVNVLFELELAGTEDILTQVLKLSEDTLIVPAQFVSDVLVVAKLDSIPSENVTMKLPVTGKHLSVNGKVNTVDPRVNCKDSTDGAIVSTT